MADISSDSLRNDEIQTASDRARTFTPPAGSGRLSAEQKKKIFLDSGRIEDIEENQTPDELFQELVERIRVYHPSDDLTLIKKAYSLAFEAHKNQKRKSGEPFVIHPLCVSIILADLELDKESIIAGLLHDVVEDTEYTDEDIEREFGHDVAVIVDGVTKLDKLNLSGENHFASRGASRLDLQAENLRKMFMAMAKDIRVILVKLADRLHNMRTLKYQSPEKQKEKARETLEIYCPIASRLGISRIKTELDDLSLKYLDPDAYYDLVEKIAIRRSDRERYISGIVSEVKNHIDSAGIEASIDGRIKHFFSIYKKMKNQNKTIDQIYDLFAIRIIVDSVRDCYAALGVIHEMYTPLPGRFKDYIAMPKANMYQSLHTTLAGESGQFFEVQIRTYEMHKAAEYGIAAHWKYKEASDGKEPDTQEQEKLIWLRQILEWQRDMSDNLEFMDLLKNDLNLFSDKVYCITPQGEVIDLPAGSTPIDFAYAIHSHIGNHMTGVRVNGKIETYDYRLENGDRVEILTSNNSKPSIDWLSIARSTQARNKINQWFKNEGRAENVNKGREAVLAYCKAHNVDTACVLTEEYRERARKRYGFPNWDGVLAAIGRGGLKEGQVVNKMEEYYAVDHKKNMSDSEVLVQIKENTQKQETKAQKRHHTGLVAVKGVRDVAVRFSKCCSPVPGDEITGFVTRGRGVTIHRTDCINIVNLPEEDRMRLIPASWLIDGNTDQSEAYSAECTIIANNRNGLIADISRTLTEHEIDIMSMNTRVSRQGIATIVLTFGVHGKDELKSITNKLSSIESVIRIERTNG
ncbi:MAG: bifunctional (p)ppGpp synthetase/guanosine-3',5'-bis(diphosphate) 3'-pyrophosphohydrolase [Lachnospiraceae bacterium]|nr:bifunctional (p)ppGpp synthetase/guanosine-3',5'-bis(diphosphate) 3'-pyrophosphohydrolase [Lachnospiraceae bacterium]